MEKNYSLIATLFRACLAMLACLGLNAQVPPFVEGPVFGGTKLFLDSLTPPVPNNRGSKDYFALGYASGDQAADEFMSYLEDFSGSPSEIEAAIDGIAQSPWGIRSRAYGLAMRDRSSALSIYKVEMTSLWANVLDRESVGFDVRRCEVICIASTYMGTASKLYYGATLRIERWAMGEDYQELHSYDGSLGQAKHLLNFSNTSNSSITYAVDAFAGLEVVDGIRLAASANRMTARNLWDVEEKPQYRIGAQMDLGVLAQLTFEKDINEAKRMPFPVDQKTDAASIKIRANAYITFAVGAERKTMEGGQTTAIGLNAWITGKKNHLGFGFQFGQGQAPMGMTWKRQ
jgi:hypothetical protein